MPIRVNTEFLPLYVIHHDGPVSDAEFAEHLEEVTAGLYAPEAGLRVLIADALRAGQAPATQRRMQAEWIQQHEARIQELTLGMAFVLPSALVRGVLTAVLWLSPLPIPHHICSNLNEALDWAEPKLQARGLSIPVGARRALCGPGPDLVSRGI